MGRRWKLAGLGGVWALASLWPALAGPIDLAAMPHLLRDGVVETPSVIYASDFGYRPLDLTIFRPANEPAALPIIIAVHGGGWYINPYKPVAGTPPQPDGPVAETTTSFDRLAARGYVVATVSYRLSSEAKFPAQIHDLKRAVRFIRAHAADFGGDPNHIIAWGSSAGGYLVSLLGTSCGVADLEPPGSDEKISDCVDAVAAWYAPIDFKVMDAEIAQNNLPPDGNSVRHDAPDGPESRLLGCALPVCPADLLKRADPLTYITSRVPPFLIVQGLADRAVPYQQAQLLAERLRAAGGSVSLHLVPGADHMFLGIPSAPKEQITQETFAFFDRMSGKK